MKKIQEDKLSALLDRLPTSVKRAFMSKTEKAKDIDMTDARDAYYDLPKRMRAKIDALIDPDTGRVRAGANSEELGESLASDLNKAGYKTWKYTDPSGKVFFAYGKDENQAKQYLVLKSTVDRSLKGKFDNIDTSEIEATGRGVGIADRYIQAIYKKETDAIEKKELPLFTTENKNKMKVNQLRQIIKEEISKVLNENLTMDLIAAVDDYRKGVGPERSAAYSELTSMGKRDYEEFVQWLERSNLIKDRRSTSDLMDMKQQDDLDRDFDRYDF